MHAHDMTEWHRAELAQQNARARQEVSAASARATGPAPDTGGDEDDPTRLWNMGGHYAFLFCLWFVFIAPIVMILTHWD